jgi:hypothetical protein
MAEFVEQNLWSSPKHPLSVTEYSVVNIPYISDYNLPYHYYTLDTNSAMERFTWEAPRVANAVGSTPLSM